MFQSLIRIGRGGESGDTEVSDLKRTSGHWWGSICLLGDAGSAHPGCAGQGVVGHADEDEGTVQAAPDCWGGISLVMARPKWYAANEQRYRRGRERLLDVDGMAKVFQ